MRVAMSGPSPRPVRALRRGRNRPLPLRPVADFTAAVQLGQVSSVQGGSGRRVSASATKAVSSGATTGAAPTKFDPEDLIPLTRAHLQTLPLEAVRDRILALGVPADQADRFWAAVRENIDVLDDMAPWWALCRDGAVPSVAPEDAAFVAEALALLPEPPWAEDAWPRWTADVKAATGRKGKALFLPLRKALTGRSDGPDMATLMPLLRHRPRLG